MSRIKQIYRHNKKLNKARHSSAISVLRKNAKSWVVVDPEGSSFKIYNLKRFCSIRDLDYNKMYSISNGSSTTCDDWICFRPT